MFHPNIFPTFIGKKQDNLFFFLLFEMHDQVVFIISWMLILFFTTAVLIYVATEKENQQCFPPPPLFLPFLYCWISNITERQLGVSLIELGHFTHPFPFRTLIKWMITLFTKSNTLSEHAAGGNTTAPIASQWCRHAPVWLATELNLKSEVVENNDKQIFRYATHARFVFRRGLVRKINGTR